MDISRRKQVILAEIVALHTDSGDPIGSRLLQEFLTGLDVFGDDVPDYLK